MPTFSGGSGFSWLPFGGGAGDPGRRGYTAGWFALELDYANMPVGFVTQIDGGGFRSELIQDHYGDDPYVSKSTGKPKYDDFTVAIGMPSSMRLFSWVKASLEGKPQRHNGALVGFDNFFGRRERSRRTFTDALISELTFPTLDAATSNNAPANILLKVAPEKMRYEQGSSTFNPQQARDESIKQKRWSTQNFGFRLDGFWGGGSQRNARIDSFTIKQTIMEDAYGTQPHNNKEAGRVEYPNITVTFGEGYTQDWFRWYEETMSGKVTRRSGSISWYAPDMRTELMRLNLYNVGLINLELDRYEAAKVDIAKAKATLYVERMELVAGAGNV